jgi:hypothetical protein
MAPPSSIKPAKAEDFKTITISSPAFKQNEMIPSKYTCDGVNINPPLDLQNIPPQAKSLTVIVDDPDAPAGTWVHWTIWNIPVTHHISEGYDHGVQGVNDFKKNNYGGPCPPSGTHRYNFKVYALNETLQLPPTVGKKELEKAMSDHILGFGVLTGVYSRNK